ncbi:efflux RND transporter periplasmic adaptor subunit [Sulfuriferula thiophila]|uniref:efflux RND transporter periplasmic adaptor subunit n=1 Tax=Sulfuriferula thiophila TaxID=1781211 RepID=UPI000F60E387|nr:efflux RND transporter periplasmic adaptor subunit [Sulfuriferula thiophila]
MNFVKNCAVGLAGMAVLITSLPAAAVDVALTTPVSGVVKSVLVKQGQSVKKGQVLVTLDDAVYQARVMEAEGGVERLKADEQEAGRDLKRAKELYDRAVSSTTEYEQAQVRYSHANGLYKEAQARLLIARKHLEYATLRAPFDGTVSKRLAEPGMVVSADLQPATLIILNK